MNPARRLTLIAIAVAAVQIGILGSMILGRASILRSGREVVLEVQPVDPRDLLRGDYVRVGYDISTLPAELFGASRAAVDPEERTIYVRLRPDENGISRPVAARYGTPPDGAPAPEEVDVKGTTYVGPQDKDEHVPVDYDIERFYLPEGEGRPIEEGIGVRPFRMKVAVAKDGTPQIKAFFDGETMIFSEPLY